MFHLSCIGNVLYIFKNCKYCHVTLYRQVNMIVMVSCSQLSEMKRKTLSRVKRHTISMSMSMSTETPILVSVTYHIIICLKGQPLKDIPFLEVISSFDFLFVVEGFLSVPPQKRVTALKLQKIL